ncbi:MAG: KGK domain-containing protein [Nostoc sp.]|uniref:KGK domain-containing protein n=1 Tax=Nostoc sp. TaxID=1180 RepID=UPI002FF47B9B
MNNEIILHDDDVVSMDKRVSFTGNATSTCGELIESLKDLAFGESTSQRNEIASGITCKVLLTKGGGWQKGRLRLRLDFVPDEPEVSQQNSSIILSQPELSLDDLRSQLNPE